MWQVRVQLQNGSVKMLNFATQADALADIQRHNFGQLIPPNGSAAASTSSAPGLPPSNTGWWKVASGGRSWKFSNAALAQRCAQATGGSISASIAPEARWSASANPSGPSYY